VNTWLPCFCRVGTTVMLFLWLQICRALAYIHNGIAVCHRDIKPQNLLVRHPPRPL